MVAQAPERFVAPTSPGEVGLLFSFHYFSDREIGRCVQDGGYQPTTFVDSGGFSAHTQGATIDVAAYCSWLRRNAAAVNHYANLDVIGDRTATFRNQLRMEDAGLRPLPVVHYQTSPHEIVRYANRGHRYLCLGGMVPHLGRLATALRAGSDHDGLRWMRNCHRVAAEHGVGLHGFGVTSWGLLRAFPWASADSSAWSAGVRYGRISIFDPGSGRWNSTGIRDVPGVMRMAGLLRSYGVDPVGVLRDAQDTRRLTVLAAVRSWVAAMRWMKERGQSTRVYLVVPSGAFGDGTDVLLWNAVRAAAGVQR